MVPVQLETCADPTKNRTSSSCGVGGDGGSGGVSGPEQM